MEYDKYTAFFTSAPTFSPINATAEIPFTFKQKIGSGSCYFSAGLGEITLHFPQFLIWLPIVNFPCRKKCIDINTPESTPTNPSLNLDVLEGVNPPIGFSASPLVGFCTATSQAYKTGDRDQLYFA